MAATTTTSDLVQLVRDDLDEANVVDVSSDLILRKLNRAQRTTLNKVLPKFDELFLTSSDITTDGSTWIDMPDDIFGQRIEHINQVVEGDERPPLTKVSHRRASRYSATATSTRPSAYTVRHNQYRILRTPASGLTFRVHYTRVPETLVLPQGRVVGSGTDGDTSQPYVSVDALGSSLTTENTNLYNYVNIINHRTGKIRATLQIASLDTDNKRVLFKASGLGRSTVLGKTVSTSLPTDLSVDDYICVVHGTCVSEIPKAYQDYLVQHAVVSVKRSKQEPTTEDYADLKDQEDDVTGMWTGRESTLRITKQKDRLNSYRR